MSIPTNKRFDCTKSGTQNQKSSCPYIAGIVTITNSCNFVQVCTETPGILCHVQIKFEFAIRP